MPKTIALIAAFLMTALVWGGDARAQLPGDDSHIQLKHIMAPSLVKPGSPATRIRPLTPIMTVPKAEDVPFVCQRAPRAAEAILNYFYKNPAPVTKKGELDVKTLDDNHRLVAAHVNRAFGKPIVSEVYFIEGGKSFGSGMMGRLPFAQSQGCGRVMEEYEKRLKEALGEGEGGQ
ncbi:MAG: hypothetical protein HQL36_06575 [Alphaproteobacteria bacterium]|nr:hypothetical protein [Alphaproteobacteria bacterium]MBF0250714.1 hypothetical protein [Alphaproteobacteria bacterium]